MAESINLKLYSPLALAYLGDSVFDLMIKEHFVREKNMQPQKYNKKVTAIVCARNQAAFMAANMEWLTDPEKEIYRWGRNANSHSKAKHASLSEYKKATGFEALVGYLYLDNQKERLSELVKRVLIFSQEQHEAEEQT